MPFVRIDEDGNPQPVSLKAIKQRISSRSAVPPADDLAAIGVHQVARDPRPEPAWNESVTAGPVQWDGVTATQEWIVTTVDQPTQDERKGSELERVRLGIARRILASDWTQLPDSGLTAAQVTAWATWRTRLRNLYAAPDPFAVDWPSPPQAKRAEFNMRLQFLRG